MEKLIGRQREREELREAMESARSEFVILYGRRRIGKTFLVRHYFEDNYAFHFVGIHHQPQKKQLEQFRKALVSYSGDKSLPVFSNWQEAFEQLEDYLSALQTCGKKVLFFDEMPWIDSRNSDFTSALEYFWNSWVSGRDDIVLIACGSASAWMKDKLLDNRGGLHNRITRQIYLRPFNLLESEEYLAYHGFSWDRFQIIQCYMVFGGVPFYLSLLKNHLSLPENIDALLFARDGLLRQEFDEMYSAIFSNADKYVQIIRALAEKRQGMMRGDIEKTTGISGGTLTKMLNNLKRCDFITSLSQLKNKKKNEIFMLCDFFTLFHMHFIENDNSRDEQYWLHHFKDRSVEVWQGLTFELVCQMHLAQLKKALGISGIATYASAWQYRPPIDAEERGLPTEGTQIDLVIERADKMIHLCEMKFSENEYILTKDHENALRRKQAIFTQVTGKRSTLLTFITPNGISNGKHSGIIQCNISANELFT